MAAGALKAALVLQCFVLAGANRLSGQPREIRDHAATDLECGFRKLAYAKALKMQPWMGEQIAVWDALELTTMCNETRPTVADHRARGRADQNLAEASRSNVIWVDAERGSDSQDGSEAAPKQTVHAAVLAARAHSAANTRANTSASTITLKGGIHFVGENGTLEFDAADSGMTITSAAGETAWLSGGKPLPGLSWTKSKRHTGAGDNVWVADLSAHGDVNGVKGLFTLGGDRFVRARFPNVPNPETTQWGYSTPDKDTWSFSSDMVAEWHKPAKGASPTPTRTDFSTLPNAANVLKNNSEMPDYNTFTTGQGGVCTDVWEGTSYWCSNTSAGGWAEVDFGCAKAGQLNLPVGVTINFTANKRGHDVERFKQWQNPEGAVIAAWHSQSWFLNFFTVQAQGSDASNGVLKFSKGGSQGGRNWCRCDQCPYAANLWAGHQWCDVENKDDRLISGSWMAENVFEELDHPGEYFYNASTNQLFVWPNATGVSGAASRPALTLVVPMLQTIVGVKGSPAKLVSDFHITNVNFRDAAAVYEEMWSVPSGGDWAFHRSAAVELNNVASCTVSGGLFRRLDGNAILLSGTTRDVTIEKNEFTLIGQNVLAGWGDTKDWDGRAGTQPRGTVVKDNFIHEIGFFEKQSSAWFQAKTALTTISNNIMFNMPRAAINFNDGFGGGNVVEDNLIFNTCRESGDHGPINTWDRQTFITDLGKDGADTPNPQMTEIRSNFIFANYGAAQGVDNDDGSSYYSIHDNVFFDADGFKMDYGGHGSQFYSNLVVTKPFNGDCLGLGGFFAGEGDAYYGNKCVLMGGSGLKGVGSVSNCDTRMMDMHDNEYYTPTNNASLHCGGSSIPVGKIYAEHGLEKDSTSNPMPTDDAMFAWAKQHLGM